MSCFHEQYAVYHEVRQSDASIRFRDGSYLANPFDRSAFMYPAEYNTYGTFSTPNLTWRTDSIGNWRQEYNIFDHLGNIRTALRENSNEPNLYDVRAMKDNKPFGGEIVSTGDESRSTYIGKEKDNESYLGDFGVRKFDYGIGRFTSIDPL